MALGDRLIGNSAFLMMDWIAITVLSLSYWLVIGKTLPPDTYGITATAINIMLIVSGISLLGLHTTMTKLISEFKEARQEVKVRNLVRFCTKWGLIFSAVTGAALAIGAQFFSPILNLPVDAVIVTGIGIFLFSVWSITNAVLYGLQNMKRIMFTDLFGNIIKVAVTVGLIFVGFSYFGPLVGLLISIASIIVMRFDILLLARKSNGNQKSARLDQKSIFKYSLAALVASVAMIGFANTPNIILNALTDPFTTGLFAITLTITSPIFSIPGVLNTALFPITSGLSGERGGRARQRIFINMVVKYASLIIVPLIAILVLFSGTIILFFSSGDFLPAVSILPIVGIAAFFYGIGNILNSSIYAARKPVASRNIIILTMVVFLSLSIPLSLTMSATGMAIAYLVSVTIFCIASGVYLRNFMGLRIDVKSIGKIFVATAIFSAVIFGIDKIVDSTILKFVAVVLGLFMYLIILIPLRYYKKEDLRILDTLQRRMPVGKSVLRRIYKIIERSV